MPKIRLVIPFALALALAVPCAVAGPPRPDGRSGEAVDTLLSQIAAWNRGDLEAFTAMYADDCTFVTPNGITRGRLEVLERYRKRYPDRAAMGTLTLDVEESRALAGPEPGARSAVAIVARWTLAYAGDPEREDATGWTLVILERDAGGAWTIVQDASM